MNKLAIILLASLLLGCSGQAWGWFDGQLCDHSCADCWYGYDPGYCYNCGPNRYYINNWLWYYYCPCYSGYYDDGYSNACQPCSYRCSTCQSSATYCTACNGAYRGSTPSCACVAGYYDGGSPNCQPCHYSCSTCGNGYSCSTCNSYYNRYMLSGSNYCSCASRYYDTGSVSCVACHQTCLTCYGTASNNCYTCNSAAMRTISGNTCVCTTGYYAVSSTVEQCAACLYSCVTCVTAASTCTSCNAGLYRSLSGSSCPCIARYFENSSLVCQSCSYKCLTCVSSASNCLTCGGNRGTAPTCACLPYYYDDGSSTACIRCQYSCSSCSSLSKCDTCNSTYMRLFTSVSAFCVCPDRYYDPGSEPCTSCHPTCFRCSSSASTACTACNSGAFRALSSGSCQCMKGYYATSASVEQCQPCLYSCLNCTSSASNCVACNSTLNRVLTGSSCPCSPTYFQNSSLLCDTCHSSCATCSSKIACTTCFSSQLTVIDSTGFCSCAAGKYWNVNACSTCSYFCLTCQGSASNCTSCPTSSNRVFSTGSCACIAGYYDNSAVVCLSCSYTCQTCTTGLTTGCTLCDSSKRRSLSGGACICGTGYFDDGSNAACQQCNYKCLTCNAATSCLTCSSTLFRTYSATTGFCECLSNYYEANNVCLACLTTCLTCKNGNTCATCNSALFRVLNTATYACDCMTGYYQNSSGLCAPCLSLCSTCISGSTCLTCKPNLNRTLNSNTSTCDCLTGYILVSSSNLCLTCQATCLTCVTNYTNRCASCNNSTLRSLNNTSFQCQCPSTGYYDDGVNLICQPCSYTCLSCSSATACLSCPSGSNRVYDSVAKTCLCKQHYYDNNVTFVQSATCLSCLYHCSTCMQASTCLTCNASNFRVLANAKCTCLPAYYDDFSNQLCIACSYRCLTCTNSSACLACNSSWNRDTPALKCPCSTGYYDNSAAVCLPCHYSCLTCTVGNKCATCQGLYNRVSNSSSKLCSCTVGFYDPGTAICQACSYSCLTCVTTGSTCLSCNTTFQRTFNATSSSCPCNNGYYDNAAPLCLPCIYSCSTCSNNRSCLSCNITRFRTINSLTGSCVCITSYYDNNSTETCLACQSTCLTCINSTNCTSCDPSRNRVLNHTADYANATDYFCPCLYKHYSLGANSSCSPCHFSCSYCSSSSSKSCLYCNAASFRKLMPSGSCTCIDGYYDTNATEACPSCNVGCLTCWDRLTTTCFTCNSTNFMMEGANTCYFNCPVYYFNNITAMICTLCQAHCLYCIDSTNCTQCEAPMFLFNSTCMPICPLTYYPNSTTHRCEACKDGCANCTTSSNCFKCVNTSYYVDQATTLCQLCSSACLTCFGPTENNCLNCTYPLFLNHRYQCVNLSCSYGKYLDTFKGCQPCKTLYPHSITCNITHAFLCDNKYLLRNARCLACGQVTGYALDAYGKCNEICGDGILIYYQCDDGNNRNGDGCSANCIIEDGWNCTVDAQNKSICMLEREISISLRRVIKFARKNTVRIKLLLSLPLQLSNNNFFLAFSNLSTLYYNYDVRDQDQTKLTEVSIDINYERDIQKQRISLSYSQARRLQEVEGEGVESDGVQEGIVESGGLRALQTVTFTSSFDITAFPPANYITSDTYIYYDIATQIIFYLGIVLTLLNVIVIPRRYALHSLTFSWVVPYLYFTLFYSTSYSTEWISSITTKLKYVAAYWGLSLGDCCAHDYIQGTTSELISNVGGILSVLAVSWVIFAIISFCSSNIEAEPLQKGRLLFKYYLLTAHLYFLMQITFASTSAIYNHTLNNRIDAINVTAALFLLIGLIFFLISLCYITSISKFDGSFQEKSSKAATRQTVHNSKDTEQNESNIVINLSNIKDGGRQQSNQFANSTTHLASSIVLNKNGTHTSGFTAQSRERSEQSDEEEMGEDESFFPFDYCYLYNHSHPKSKYFLPLLIIKVFLYALTSATLPNYPFIMTTCHALITTIFLIYLFASKPFKSKFTLVRVILVEGLVLVIQGMFAVYQYFAISYQYIRNIEFYIILMIMILLACAVVFALVEQLKIWHDSIKKLCENCCLSLRLKGKSKRVYDQQSQVENESNIVKVQAVKQDEIGEADAFYARMLQKQALNKQYKRQRMIYDSQNTFN